MAKTLCFTALFLTMQITPGSAESKFLSPSQAWAYASAELADWDAAVAARKEPKTRFRPAGEMEVRANALCPDFQLETVSGEELYWLAKLCEYEPKPLKALTAAEHYLATARPEHGSEARRLLAILQMRVTKRWESSWDTYRTILRSDPIDSEVEVAARVAIEEEADRDEVAALRWSQDRYTVLLERARNQQEGLPPVAYEWVLMAAGDLVHRYYLSGDADRATALVREMEELKQQHSGAFHGWAADAVNWAAMEMKPAPPVPVLKALGHVPGPDIVQKGRVEVVHFIFLRCAPCITQLPDLDDLQKRYKNKGVLVASVTTYRAALQPDLPPHAQIESALERVRKKESPQLTMAVSPEQTLAEYKVTAFPVLAVIDKHGRLRYTGQSNQFDEGEEIDRLVQKLLAE